MGTKVNTGGSISFAYENKGDNSQINYSLLAEKLIG